MCVMGEPPSVLYITEDEIIWPGSSSLSNNLSNGKRRVSPRKGATRKNLSMFLMADSEAALLIFVEEKAVEGEGRLMSTSAVQHAALACYGVSLVSDDRWHYITVATARLNDPALSALQMPFPLRVVQPCIHRLYWVANNPRCLSGMARYPAIHDFATSLAQSQPSFTISSEKVHVLSNPVDFYTQLTVSHQ